MPRPAESCDDLVMKALAELVAERRTLGGKFRQRWHWAEHERPAREAQDVASVSKSEVIVVVGYLGGDERRSGGLARRPLCRSALGGFPARSRAG
jgi:hypothetical protein